MKISDWQHQIFGEAAGSVSDSDDTALRTVVLVHLGARILFAYVALRTGNIDVSHHSLPHRHAAVRHTVVGKTGHSAEELVTKNSLKQQKHAK